MTTTTLIISLIALALLIFIAAEFKLPSRTRGAQWPYYAKKPLSVPEQVLYFRLTKALPEHIVLAQVQLSRILGVKRGHRFHEWNNRINRLSADFVICRRDATVIAVIELDDSTHDKSDRKITDEKKTKALQSAGVTLIRWHPKNLPDNDQIITALPTP